MSTAVTAPPAAPAPPRRELRAWVNVGVAALAMIATLPGRTHGLGLVTEPLLRDFGMDRVLYGTINLWATLLGAAFCLPCGWLIDRLGIRRVLAGVMLALGLVVVGMSVTHQVLVLAVLILLTRGFGQSALSVVSLAIIGKASPRHRGIAMGVYSVLIGLGFAECFRRIQTAEAQWGLGWRELWLGIGVALLGLLPLGLLLLDESAGGGRADAHDPADAAGGATLKQALCSPAFWAFGLATSFYGLVASGISLFNESVLQERGFDRAVYLEVQTYTFLMAIGFNVLIGWLSQRWPMGRLLGLGMLVLAGALLALPHVETIEQVYAYAVAMAFAGGAATVIFFAIWRHAYGAANLGQIQGVAQMLTVLASALGPLLLALSKDRAGSYAPLFQGLAVAAAVLGVWVWCVRLPGRSPAPVAVD